MKNIKHTVSRSAGNMPTRLLLSLLATAVFIGLLWLLLAGNGHSATTTSSDTSTADSPSSNTQASSSYAVLSPATVPPKVPECSTQITYQSDGNSGPITCGNGALNVLEWNALAALEPKVMSLGYSPSESQVAATLCADASDSNSDATTRDSTIIETTTYQISALYYGWSFPTNPTTVLSNSQC